MKILYIASEAAPFATSGGLADVAGSLPAALSRGGDSCAVMLPLYKSIDKAQRQNLRFIKSFTVELGWRKQYCGLFEGSAGGVTYYFLDNEYYFFRDNLYGYYDDAERFAFFSKAVLQAIVECPDLSFDILHCNDWQTALVPVYLDIFFRSAPRLHFCRTVFTIHNIQYQGRYSKELISDLLGIPESLSSLVLYDDNCNFMKGGIEAAGRVTTVSPSYAAEILDPWFAHGLDRFLQTRKYKLSGILNGLDLVHYNPEADKAIFANYSAGAPAKKAHNKKKLREMLGLSAEGDRPLVAMITRLVPAKGIDLLKFVLDRAVADGFQFVVLGSGDRAYEDYLRAAAERYPTEVAVVIGFIPDLAQKIYAGADLFLMPSKSEPCGLAQMIAARYGALPIVREVGGLRDSIRDMDEEGGNGFTFKTYNADDMYGAMMRAKALCADKAKLKAARVRAMKSDFSWERSAAAYKALYSELL